MENKPPSDAESLRQQRLEDLVQRTTENLQMQLQYKGTLVNFAHKAADLTRKLERLDLGDQRIALMNRRNGVRDMIRDVLAGRSDANLADLQRELAEAEQSENRIEEQIQRFDTPTTVENEETRRFREQFNAIDSWQAPITQNGVQGNSTFQKIAWVSGYAHRVLAESIDKDVATIHSFKADIEADLRAGKQTVADQQRLRDTETRVQHSIRLYDDIQQFILSMYHS